MLTRLPHPGLIAAAALAALIAAALAGLASAGGGLGFHLSPYLRDVVRGAAWQAALSTSLSLLLGTALALALARRTSFIGRRALLALITAATVAPTIVIIFGVVAVHGRSGPLHAVASALGLPPLPAIYGLHGIVLAHVMMNAPLVTRVMLAALDATPAEQTRLAGMLRFSPADCFRHLDWPVIRREWPGLAAFIFLLCFTSFAVVLSLGGGPANATLEVAIYQALRLEVDFARAAAIAMVQIALCLAFVLGFSLLGAHLPDAPGQIAARRRPDAASAPLRLWDIGIIALAAALVAPVMLSVLTGLPQWRSLISGDVAEAAVTSALLAALAASIAVSLAVLLASAAEAAPLGRTSPARARAIDLAVLAVLGLPPFALVTGLFVLLRGSASLGTAGLVLVPLVNALMALPFVYRLLAPPLRQSAVRHGRLGASLGLGGLAHLRIVAWPVLKRPLAAALALSAALSLGDFGVIALFGGGDLVTLPYLMAERMGSYRLAEAGAIALVLVLIAVLLAFIADNA
jgi:thiamine transport system permease protein